ELAAQGRACGGDYELLGFLIRHNHRTSARGDPAACSAHGSYHRTSARGDPAACSAHGSCFVRPNWARVSPDTCVFAADRSLSFALPCPQPTVTIHVGEDKNGL